MGLLKDIYDTILKDTRADSQIKNFINSLFKSKKKLNDKEKIQRHRDLVHRFTQDDFAEEFTDLLSYFGVVLAMIVETTYLKHKGVIVSNFYSSKYYFYFPAPEEETNLKPVEVKGTNEKGRGILFQNGSYYRFYAIEKNSAGQDLNSLKQLIVKTIRDSTDNEIDALLKEFENSKINCEWIVGIAQIEGKGQRYKFIPISFNETKDLQLSFSEPRETKEAILKDLNELLDFRLV